MNKALTQISSLGDYHARPYKRSHVSLFQICLIAVIALAVSAFLFALVP
jgi:hypothetical protein